MIVLNKKQIERCVLEAARKAGAPIPAGEGEGEEPDFRFQTQIGALGIEVSELVRPACTNRGPLPLEQENFRRRILENARKECLNRGVPPVRVHLYFADTKGKKQDWRELTRSLIDLVGANYQKAAPTWTQTQPHLPEWFEHILIISEDGEWWSPTVGGISVSQIHWHIASRIAAKEIKLPTYRRNLPSGAAIWLLLHSGVTIARSVEVPLDIEEWRFPFRFDRVFWFSFLEGEVVEIHRAPEMPAYCRPWICIEFVCECGMRCGFDVELLDRQLSGQAYRHPCGTTRGRYLPGRILRAW
jgi:hypothetical protein